MKKSLLALAALTAFAGAASAQSSVTLFGIVDLAARNVKNGPVGSLKTLSSDGGYSSRLGFRGVEDIGGGLRAGFWLEAGMAADTGAVGGPAGGAFFNRRSTVSLLGNFGELRLGRDYTPTFWNHTVFDPFGTQGVGSANNLIGQATAGSGGNTTSPMGVLQGGVVGPTGDPRTLTFVRTDNSIGYFLPAMGGLYGQVMVAAGENRAGVKYTGGRLGYAAGPINVAGAIGRTDLTTKKMTHSNFGGSFNAGFATLYGVWSKFKVENGEPVVGGRDQTNWFLGATVPVGAGTIKVTYGKVDGHIISTATKASANQVAAGYVYDLSKRTSLYTHYGRVKNDAGLRFVASGSGVAPGANTGFTSTGYEFGIRHNF
jgi:predicted porin